MSWQFRQSKKVGPFRFTLSQKGIGGSVGAGPFRVGRGADGKYRRTVRIPGTGLYNTETIGDAARTPRRPRSHRTIALIVGGLFLLIVIASCIGGGHKDTKTAPITPRAATQTVVAPSPVAAPEPEPVATAPATTSASPLPEGFPVSEATWTDGPWPFTVDRGGLYCTFDGVTLATGEGTMYAVNDTAKAEHLWEPVDSIWIASRPDLGPVIDLGLAVCGGVR